MTSVNPGPAVTSNPNSVAVLTPQNALGPTTPPQGANALRLIAVGRAVPLSGTGDVAFLPIINASSWVPATIAFTNGLVNGVSATIATVSLGVFTGAGATGTTIRTAGVLTGQTASTVFTNSATAGSTASTNFQLSGVYVNVGTALAGATADIFLYGYDVS